MQITDEVLGYSRENEELKQGGGPDHRQREASRTGKPVRRIIFGNTGISRNEDILVMERVAMSRCQITKKQEGNSWGIAVE